MKNTLIVVAICAVIAILGFSASAYIVTEADQVFVTQFGERVGDTVTTKPGLYFKIPVIQVVHRFEKRFLEWDGERNQVPTRDKRFVYVDTYARWRISDAFQFFTRLRDESGARSRLDDILDGETRNVIAGHDLIEVVRSSNREFAISEDQHVGGAQAEPDAAAERVQVGRDRLAALVLEKAGARIKESDLGIEVLDFKFKRINYVEDVRAEVYARMISERKRIAEQFRSEGAGESAKINGDRDRELKRITSEAYAQAQEVKGKADAEAAKIYADAYSADPEFFSFYKTMETYQQTIDENTYLLMSTQGEFLSHIEGKN
ncbi:MAG: protease modulator HflC [Candidatus Schekmanbacteria bacterium]|nr:protease modulator HflC [Candidatus Schekmanbacteria bacterium]